jgi:hypothetical protein
MSWINRVNNEHFKLAISQGIRAYDICSRDIMYIKEWTIYIYENIHAQRIICFGILVGDYLTCMLIFKFGLYHKSSSLLCTFTLYY